MPSTAASTSQISQLYLPIARDGAVSVRTQEGERTIRIHELHMEEDAGKLVHDPWLDQTRADYNRCGVPLIEIVTEPDFRTADQVIAYLEQLKETLQYLGVSDCKMQEGSLRCDVNLSVRPADSRSLGTRTEMKNLNSFKAIARAIEYESQRQIELLEQGRPVVQETRRWDENKDASYPMRSKEDAQDYRYFPEPDLPPLELSEAYIQALRASQPELATAKRARYQAAWGLGPYDAEMLTSQKALARFFEETVALGAEPKQAANWLMGPVLAQLSAHGLEARDMALTPPTLARLIQLVKEGQLNRNTAVKVCEAVFETDGDVDAYVAAHGLAQVSDAGLVAQVVEQVLSANEKSVADYRSGKEKASASWWGRSCASSGARRPRRWCVRCCWNSWRSNNNVRAGLLTGPHGVCPFRRGFTNHYESPVQPSSTCPPWSSSSFSSAGLPSSRKWKVWPG